MTDMIGVDKNYSTTRMLAREQPTIENNAEDKFESVLFLPEGEGRQGEGGLRTLGYFKTRLSDKPLITVVTVVFNGEQFLEETIQSVINQTYDNVEYIIVDGGSTDGTLDIIRKYEYAIDYWLSEKDGGIYDAMNKGIDLAGDGWVNFMNSGDMFFDLHVVKVVSENLNADLVYGNHAPYTQASNKFEVVDAKFKKDTRNIPFCHQSLFAKSRLLKEFHFDLRYQIAADYNQYLMIKRSNATMKHVSIPVVLYLEGGISAVSKEKVTYEYYDITKKYYPINAFFVKVFRLIKYKIFKVT